MYIDVHCMMYDMGKRMCAAYGEMLSYELGVTGDGAVTLNGCVCGTHIQCGP